MRVRWNPCWCARRWTGSISSTSGSRAMSKHLEHEMEMAPAFYDIDPMNVVWHGNYVKFMELARAELLAKLNFGYHQMVECGYLFPVIELFVRYAQPLVLGQRVKVIAKIVEWESRLKVTYE